MEKQKKAYLFASLAILFWSTSASAFKICLDRLGVSVLALLFGASVVSSVALFLNLLLSGKAGLLKSLSKEDITRSAFLGFLNPFLYYVVLFKAYSLLRAQEAQPLNFVQLFRCPHNLDRRACPRLPVHRPARRGARDRQLDPVGAVLDL